MNFYTERQVQVLEALGTYQYLTSEQLQKVLGVQTVSYVNKLLRALLKERSALIEARDFGFFPKQGRIPKLYFLTKRGSSFLIQELGWSAGSVKQARTKHPLYARDLFHRMAVVDFHIQFRNWAHTESQSPIFRSYFEGDSELVPPCDFSTSTGLVKADAVGIFGDEGDRRAFLLEQHNGVQSLRALRQIQQHVRLLAEGRASEVLGCRRAVGVFFVFEDQDCMKNTLQRLQKWEQFEAFQDLFWFRSRGDTFLDGWIQVKLTAMQSGHSG